jgi:hypothetical protein
MVASVRRPPTNSSAPSAPADPLGPARAILLALVGGLIAWAGIIWAIIAVASRLWR